METFGKTILSVAHQDFLFRCEPGTVDGLLTFFYFLFAQNVARVQGMFLKNPELLCTFISNEPFNAFTGTLF